MKQFGIFRSRLLSSGAALITGASLAGLAGLGAAESWSLFSLAQARLSAVDQVNVAFDFPICASAMPVRSAAGLMRLAQVEVPRSEMSAVVPSPAFVDTEPPLWDGLGSISYKVTTSQGEAQRFFDQGLRLGYAFNHDEARRAFRKAQRLDPDCAMCYWGEALVLGPNINLPMQEDAVAPALAALRKAQALAAKASPREQALIAALGTRYVEDPKVDRAPLDAAYAAAMGKTAAQFPEDNEITVLYAESLMDVSPWDYWEPGGAKPKPHSADIVPTLERVLARAPDHAGAIHYYIHAVEASDRPQRAEPHADRLRGAIPNAGHLVHMPSHIYYRVGRYLDALADNKTAAAVDEAYLAATNAPMGVYRLGYYPHNVHFVLAAAQMAGDGPTVIAAADKLQAIIPDEVARGIAMVHPVKAASYFAHAQFSSPDTILSLADPGDGIPYVKAMWHYARGVAHAARGAFDAAVNEANAIEALERTGDFQLLTSSGIPAQDVLKLARSVIAARVSLARGDANAAIAQLEQAAALQDGLAYTEPPYWYYPVRQSLGAALLRAGRLREAEEQFLSALKRAPNNGWSYFGLAEVYRAQGAADKLQKAEGDIVKTWIGDRSLLELSRL